MRQNQLWYCPYFNIFFQNFLSKSSFKILSTFFFLNLLSSSMSFFNLQSSIFFHFFSILFHFISFYFSLRLDLWILLPRKLMRQCSLSLKSNTSWVRDWCTWLSAIIWSAWHSTITMSSELIFSKLKMSMVSSFFSSHSPFVPFSFSLSFPKSTRGGGRGYELNEFVGKDRIRRSARWNFQKKKKSLRFMFRAAQFFLLLYSLPLQRQFNVNVNFVWFYFYLFILFFFSSFLFE